MNAVVFEHVPVAQLPQAWRDRLGQALGRTEGARVTVRIEAEDGTQDAPAENATLADDALFGMWQDREDLADVPAWVRGTRATRYRANGSRNEHRE